MATNAKDTIYIDVDDEITSIVDKLQNSDSKIVALVLPKRAVALQSIVNMKLLKRAADEAGKSPVLITSETGLLPLAGATGLYVAKNLQSKPEVPSAPDGPLTDDEELVAHVEPETAPSNDTPSALGSTVLDDTVEFENEEAPVLSKPAGGAKSPKKAKKPSKKQKIPNFEKFRKKLFIIGGALIALIALWYVAVFVAPKATIAIQTDTEQKEASLEFTADPALGEYTEGELAVPAKVAEVPKDATESAPATGQKDIGTKATGTVTFSQPCSPDTPPTIPSGTGVSANGLTYITQSSVTLSPQISGGCNFRGSSKVVAQKNGDQYNIGAASYSVSGFPDVSGSGTAMTGGSSRTVKVVTENDVKAAKEKLGIDEEVIKTDLRRQLEDEGYFVIEDSFEKKNEDIGVNPGVDQEGDEVTVEYSANFTMVGVKQEDLEKVIEASLADEIDTEKQQVQDNGLDNATFKIIKSEPNGRTTLSLETQVGIGPRIDTEALKRDIAGKKGGETENIIRAFPGVKEVEVKYSPFWVGKTPKNTQKITVEFIGSTD